MRLDSIRNVINAALGRKPEKAQPTPPGPWEGIGGPRTPSKRAVSRAETRAEARRAGYRLRAKTATHTPRAYNPIPHDGNGSRSTRDLKAVGIDWAEARRGFDGAVDRHAQNEASAKAQHAAALKAAKAAQR